MKAMLEPMMVAARTHFPAAGEHGETAPPPDLMTTLSHGELMVAMDANQTGLDS
jgi:hypothetical protein